MNCNITKINHWLLGSILAIFALMGTSVAAQKAPTLIQVVHAFPDGEATRVDITLSGTTQPTLHAEGNRLVITLPHSSPAYTLKDHLTSDGLVSGIDLEQPNANGAERVILVLRLPAEGSLHVVPNTQIVRVMVAPEGRLARLSLSASLFAKVVPAKGIAKVASTKAAPKFVSAKAVPKTVLLPGIVSATHPVSATSHLAFLQNSVSAPRLAVLTPHAAVATPHVSSLQSTVMTPRLPDPAVQAVVTPRPAAIYTREIPAVPAQTHILISSVPMSRVRLYNINAYQSDLAGVLNSLALDSHVNVVMLGAVSSKVTMHLRQVPLEKAVDLLTKSAGLGYHRDGDVFMVGDAKSLALAYPAADAAITQTVYRCVHVTASDVVTTLQNTFDKEKLRVSLGAGPSSPRLDDATAANGTGAQATTMKNTDATTGGLSSHFIVLSGEAGIVAQALDLAHKLDARRTQVKIGVQISDINRSSLKNLGLQWNFGSIGLHESQPNGIGFGSFNRDPLSVSATITALENSGNAKLLAAPNMSILDGERGFILIGDRIQYPKLTGYTQAQTPIYDVTEERVGIYLQVAVQMEDNGEITLTIYPQISTVSGYLNVNGASYPQISTREQQTTIRVKDGQQIVVGGLIRDEEINNVQRVPLLSQIPLFKELFTYRNTTHQQSEVVIVITPQILKD